MGKEIEKRKGLFKTIGDYNQNDRVKMRQKELEENPIELEKNDRKALLLSAFLVIFLPSILILGIVIVVALLVFRII